MVKPQDVYMKRDNFATKWRVIVGADDTIENGVRFYEGYKFTCKDGTHHYIVSMGTVTPNSRRYSMKNWVKVEHNDVPYIVVTMQLLARNRAQPFLRSGKPYLVSERRKMIDACFVAACARNCVLPKCGVVESGNFKIDLHITDKLDKKYVPEEYNEEAFAKQYARLHKSKRHI